MARIQKITVRQVWTLEREISFPSRQGWIVSFKWCEPALPCRCIFGLGSTSGRCLFFFKKKIGEARMESGNLLFGGVCKRKHWYLLLRHFLVIVRMPQRYSACLKVVSSFKNDDWEREGNMKYRESDQITRFVGGRNYLVYWMVEGLMFMSLQTLV